MMAEVLKLKDTSMMSLEITVCKSLYLSIIVLGFGPKFNYYYTDGQYSKWLNSMIYWLINQCTD